LLDYVSSVLTVTYELLLSLKYFNILRGNVVILLDTMLTALC